MSVSISFKGFRFPKEVIIQTVFYKLRFSLSYRNIEELLEMRGVYLDHSTIQRWVFRFSPLFDQSLRKRKKTVGLSWRLDETYVKVNGTWVCFFTVQWIRKLRQLTVSSASSSYAF